MRTSPYKDLRWAAYEQSARYPSHTSLTPIHRPRRDGRLDWPGLEVRTRKLVLDARGNQHLL